FPWESFTLDLGEINIYQYPKVTIELSATQSLPLRIDLYDTQHEYPLTQNIEVANDRTILKYDYSQGFDQIDPNKSLYLLFYAAPGEDFAGKIQIHSIHFEALSTDIEEVTETVDDYVLRAFPNPTRDIFHVDLPLKPLQYINLYNTSGQVLFTQDISQDAGNRINIEVGYFPAGNYILQLEGETISYTQQVVIE
ncbi:MAG: T9SS type A sorting domain-containing protein, partial [Chitinophagales bacterium]